MLYRSIVDVLLQPRYRQCVSVVSAHSHAICRSLYIMSGAARYDYKHAILGGSDHSWRGVPFTKGRRISLVFRDDE